MKKINKDLIKRSVDIVPENKLIGFLEWAIATDYFLVKPRPVFLRLPNGAELNARYYLGNQIAESIDFGAMLCFILDGKKVTAQSV